MAEIKTRKRGELKPCAFRPRESVNRSRCDIELEYQEGARTRRITLSLPWDEAEAIADLLAMTPHLYRASQEGRAKAAELDRISLTIDIRLHTLERMGSDPRAVF